MRALTLIFAMLALTSCATTSDEVPNVPATVRVAVREPMDIPSWATVELPKPQPADGTVGSRASSNDARGHVIDLANCHRRLLRQLSQGIAVDETSCNREAQPW